MQKQLTTEALKCKKKIHDIIRKIYTFEADKKVYKNELMELRKKHFYLLRYSDEVDKLIYSIRVLDNCIDKQYALFEEYCEEYRKMTGIDYREHWSV